jgi:hypothetical protein
MSDELLRMWTEPVMIRFKVIFQNFPGGSEENYE